MSQQQYQQLQALQHELMATKADAFDAIRTANQIAQDRERNFQILVEELASRFGITGQTSVPDLLEKLDDLIEIKGGAQPDKKGPRPQAESS